MEGVGSSGHEPYLTPAGLRISSVRQVKIPVLVGRHEIFTNFGGGDTKSPPVLVGEARKSPPVLVGETRNLYQFWWERHEISTSFGGRDTKSPPVLVEEARKSPPVLVGNARNFHQPWRSPPKKQASRLQTP